MEIKTEPGFEQEVGGTNHLSNFPLDLPEFGNNIFPSEDIFSLVKTEFFPTDSVETKVESQFEQNQVEVKEEVQYDVASTQETARYKYC